MKKTEISIEDVFDIKGLGVVMVGTTNNEGTISVGDIFITNNNKKIKIKGIQMPSNFTEKVGLTIDWDITKAKELIGQTLYKK